nr:MAG TPA: Mature oligodendrocyte transmembrane protein [Caudoviricetes sp.]
MHDWVWLDCWNFVFFVLISFFLLKLEVKFREEIIHPFIVQLLEF